MSGIDDTTGTGFRPFPSTLWSDVLAAGEAAVGPDQRERLDKLFRAYWKPVYAYIRAVRGKSPDDAKDLTQAFFAQLLERGFMSRVRQDRGSFRAYLKQALRYFLIDADRAQAVRGRHALPFDEEDLDRIGAGVSPEDAYDREWFRCLVQSSIGALRKVLDRDGKGVYFEVFQKYLLDTAGGAVESVSRGETVLAVPTYEEVAGRLGISRTDVRNYLAHCRALLRQIMKERIREYVETDAEADTELGRWVGQ